MRTIANLALAGSLALLSACTIVTSRSPMGTESLAPAAADWDGTWASGIGPPVHFRVLPDGNVRMIYMNNDDHSLKAETLDWTLMKHGDWTFASAKDPGPGGEYVWVRFWRSEEQLIAWLPTPATLATWVQNGSLPGSVDENGNVHLGALDSSHLDLLTADKQHEAIMWDKPMAFVRISTSTGL